jgi:hypothetical protein
MDKQGPVRRRRRSTGFVPRIKGNALFTRCLEELEQHLSPRRAGAALVAALAQVGASPENVTLGHLVRAVDLTLPGALADSCEPGDVATITHGLSQLLDGLAAQYFLG